MAFAAQVKPVDFDGSPRNKAELSGIETTLYDEESGPAKSWRPTVPNTLMFDESFGGYSGLLENVLDAVRGLAPLATSGAHGAAAVGVIEAIRLSLAEGREIDMAAEGLVP